MTEWLKVTDCKSVEFISTQVRILLSSFLKLKRCNSVVEYWNHNSKAGSSNLSTVIISECSAVR